MTPTSLTANSPALYLFGDDTHFKAALTPELTAKGLVVLPDTSPAGITFSPHHLVVWATTDLLKVGDELLEFLSQSTFLAGKILLVFPLDKPQPSLDKVSEANYKIDGYINKYKDICHRKQIDFRSVGHLGLFNSIGLGEGTSLGAISKLLQTGYQPKLDQHELSPLLLESAINPVIRLWFDRGHKNQSVVLRGPKLNSPQINKLFSLIEPPLPEQPLSEWWAGGTGINPDDTVEINSNLDSLMELFKHLAQPKKIEIKPPKKIEAPPILPITPKPFVLPTPPPIPKIVAPLPKLPSSLNLQKYFLIALISSFLAYIFVTYGLLSITLAQSQRFNPETGDSITKYQQRLDSGLSRYQKLASFASVIPPFSTFDTYYRTTAISTQKLFLTREIQHLAVGSLSTLLGSSEGNFHQQISQAKVLLDQLYSLETQTQSSSESIDQLADIRQLVLLLPQLIPENQKVTALILLQNNLEIRPTGGFIGAVGLVTIDNGKLLTLETRDIYDLDSNLRGVVTPPAEITKYLAETSWYFRDSNWNPDFSQSAASANWFLGKEWGSTADLIIGINLNSLTEILKALGTISLPDGTSLNADNLLITGLNYQDTAATTANQPEYLSTVIKPLVQRLTQETNPQIKLEALNAIYRALKAGDITLSTQNNRLSPPLDDLRLSGSIYHPLCRDNLTEPCFSDHFYLNEANVGINKANYYLTRDSNHEVNLTPKFILHTHRLSLTNTSPNDTWPAGSYKSFLRAYMPTTTTNIQVSKDGIPLPAADVSLQPSTTFQQVSWFIETKPQTTSVITLSYEIPLASPLSSYQLFLQKQPGLLPGKLTYNLKAPTKTLTNTVDFNQHLLLPLSLLP